MTVGGGPAAETPRPLAWDRSIVEEFLTVDGHRLRYIRTGHGPPLVLLHTLRTSLDIFERLVPGLRAASTVWALDYPGHGGSDMPDIAYAPDAFVSAVAAFLATIDLRSATLAGISIGGTIALRLAAAHNPHVARVVAINPYDYAQGLGITRSSLTARLVIGASRVPLIGEAVMALRTRTLERWVMEGGVADPATLSPAFLDRLWQAGRRPGHDRAFLSLIRHASAWADSPALYGQICVPVLVVYGEHDWSRPHERRRTAAAIPMSRVETVTGGGHFLAVDQPEPLAALIEEFAR